MGVGRGPHGDELADPRRPIDFTPQYVDEVPFHEDHRRKLIIDVHLELDVVATGKAVMASVRATSVRVEGPIERHAADTVERRAADDFLVAGPIGAAIGFGQRSDPTAFHGVSDIAGGQRARAQMNKKGEGSTWWFFAHNRSLFAFTSLMVYDGRPPTVKRNRGGSMRFRGRPVLE